MEPSPENISQETAPQSEYKDVEPLFSTRAFEILALSTAPEGIQIITGKTLARPNAKSMLLAQGPYGENLITKISDDIKNKEVPRAIREAVKKNLDSPEEKARLEILHSIGLTEDQLEEYQKRLIEEKLQNPSLLSAAEKTEYIRGMERGQKIGMRNVVVSKDGNTLIADIMKVPFVAHRHIRKPEDVTRGLIEISNATGVAAVLETKESDPSQNFFGLGRRFENNGQYRASRASGGQPGAIGAGMIDLTFSRHTAPGEPERISNTKILNAIDKEFGEEVGFSTQTSGGENIRITADNIKDFATHQMTVEVGASEADIERMKIACFGRDLVAPHNEIGVVAQSSKSRAELLEIHSKMNPNTTENNFSEGMFFIPADKESVGKFLTQCRSLLPPTHYMPLIAAMYEKIATQGNEPAADKAEADAWKKEMEIGIDENWKRIDEMVKQYYIDKPTAIEENMLESKRDSINTEGYDPAVLSDRQIMEKQSDGSYIPITLDGELDLLGFSQTA